MDPIVVHGYFNACVIDVCLSDDVNRNSLCQAIEAYVHECQQLGVEVPVWRRPHFCRKLNHSNYHNCVNTIHIKVSNRYMLKYANCSN